MKLIAIFLLFVISVLPVSAQDMKKLDEYVNAAIKRQNIPGFALGVFKEGKPFYMKGYGYANIEHGVPVSSKTIFQSGSVGKQFTAAAIMLLVQDGKMSFDDPVSKHLSDVPVEWEKMTIRHLLTQTSGLGDYPENFNYRKDYTESELFEIIKTQKLEFSPGDKYRYSNLGYVTLGVVIRKVSGKFYGDFLKDRVFKPLGMDTARVISESAIVPNRAAGYVLSDGEIRNQGWVSPALNTTADGALYLSVEDMQKWDAGLRNGSPIRKETLEEAWTPVTLNDGSSFDYGFAWTIGKVTGSDFVEHSGSWQGFRAHFARYLDRDTSIVIFANSAQSNTREMIRDIAELVDPKLARIRQKSIEDDNPSLTETAKKVMTGRVAGNLQRDLFAKEKGAQAFEIMDKYFGWMSSFGKLQKTELLESTKEGVGTKRKFRFYFEDSENVVYFLFDDEGKITGFAFE